MNRENAIRIIEEIFGADRYGILATLTDEQTAAVKMALGALKEPECMRCGRCQRFADEGADGWGWCEQHDRSAVCDDMPCGYYEQEGRDEEQDYSTSRNA